MTLNERILEFLDGTLHPDDEAELLHTLSVSPEKRDMLRSFMKQDALLASDRASIAVPYNAEQSLWAKLDAVMPAAPARIVRPIPAPIGFFSRFATATTAAVAGLALMIGLGAGYYAGAQKPVIEKQVTVYRDVPVASAPISHAPSAVSQRVILQPVMMSPFPQMLMPLVAQNTPTSTSTVAPEQPVADATPSVDVVHTVAPQPTEPIAFNNIGGDGGIKPMMRHTSAEAFRTTEKSFLQRFEFAVDESIGKQFPNSVASNMSLPLITNSSVATYFQVLPHSNLLWVGGAYGTANVTHKDVATRRGNPIDPLQDVLIGDTVHSPTSYVAALAELRLPALPMADVTFTAGYGFASLGRMMIGQIGMHYDVSNEVGFRIGFRVLRFSYDLTSAMDAAIHSGKGSLVVPAGVGDASPSITTELNTGLYFHF